MPELPDALFLDYSRTGNRDRYQGVNSRRHSRCFNLILAECLENKGRFLPAIDEALRAILAEKTWVLPAHDGSLRNFEGKVVEIDLASSAMAAALATADYWLGDKFRPETRKLLRSELERRAFTPFEGAVTRGSPRLSWLTTTNNWNAVCLAGVTGAAMTAIEDRNRRAFFVASAEKYVQNFLDGFTADGYCSEGLGYWNYGFGNFMVLAEDVLQATGGGLDWWENPKIRRIAQFGRRIEIFPGVSPAFADCHIGSRGDARLMAFVSRRYGFGWKDLEQRGLLLAPGPSSGLLELGLIGFPNSASKRPAAAEPSPQGLRDWFSDAGILICRPARRDGVAVELPPQQHALGVALKGGHNAEHHNHNDVGSFVVALDGRTPLVDPGSEVYTARTFSDRRYESNVLNSFGHPVPRVAGQLQQTGRQAAAKVLKTEFTDKADTLVMDISSAYAVKESEEAPADLCLLARRLGEPHRDRRGRIRLAAGFRDGPDHLRQGETRAGRRDSRGRGRGCGQGRHLRPRSQISPRTNQRDSREPARRADSDPPGHRAQRPGDEGGDHRNDYISREKIMNDD